MFKKRSYENKKQYKTYQKLFEKIKKNYKKLYIKTSQVNFKLTLKNYGLLWMKYLGRPSKRKQFSKKSNDRRHRIYEKNINDFFLV